MVFGVGQWISQSIPGLSVRDKDEQSNCKRGRPRAESAVGWVRVRRSDVDRKHLQLKEIRSKCSAGQVRRAAFG